MDKKGFSDLQISVIIILVAVCLAAWVIYYVNTNIINKQIETKINPQIFNPFLADNCCKLINLAGYYTETDYQAEKFGHGYFCMTKYIQFGSNILKNWIGYLADGNKDQATKLEAELHIVDTDGASLAKNEYQKMITELLNNIFNSQEKILFNGVATNELQNKANIVIKEINNQIANNDVNLMPEAKNPSKTNWNFLNISITLKKWKHNFKEDKYSYNFNLIITPL